MNRQTSTTGLPQPDAGTADGRPRTLLMSIRARHAQAIMQGTKTVELRRRAPTAPIDEAVIYESGARREVIGTVRVHAVHTSDPAEIWHSFGERSAINRAEFDAYFTGATTASALELHNVRAAQRPMALHELRGLGLQAPQSWRYLDSDQHRRIVDALRLSRSASDDRRQPLLGLTMPSVPSGLAAIGRVVLRLSSSLLNTPSPSFDTTSAAVGTTPPS